MTLEQIILEYIKKTPNSKKAFMHAVEHVSGGVSANIKYFDPYPIFMKKGKDVWLTDEDDNLYVDYLLSYGPLILGHSRKEIHETIIEHLANQSSILFGTPHVTESILAERVKSYYPSIERLRYTNSGTEATLLALRLAYAYKDKYKIAKFEGHYHGGFNQVLVSVNPPISEAGNIHKPNAIPESAGLEPAQSGNTIVLPFNDLDACQDILTKHKDELAAVIMEPVIAGYIPATQSFMKGIRELTSKLGLLLIIDEVKTGFRLCMGGAPEYYGISPDLITLGKVIGSGLPFGIVGGKKDILDKVAPIMGSDVFDMSDSKKSSARDVLFHSGSYNGHPLILNMGMTVLDILEKELSFVIEQTTKLKKEITDFYDSKGIHILTPGIGTMFNIAITDLTEIITYRDMHSSDFTLRKKMDYALLLEGIYNKPGNRYNLSTAHTDDIIDFTMACYKKAFKKM